MINIIIEIIVFGPCFVDMSSVEVVWLVYKIVAISVHVGAQPNAGHYRGILMAEGHRWQTDDGKMAERLNAHDPILNSQTYMFWCRGDGKCSQLQFQHEVRPQKPVSHQHIHDTGRCTKSWGYPTRANME